MTNKDIAQLFQELAGLMELHQENKFKIRSYSNAYLTLRKLPTELAKMEQSEIEAIKGVGPAISSKIREILTSGKLRILGEYKEKTPIGIQQMLGVKGFGPKKIKLLWDELEIESIGELLYAINENRLLELKGFGAKTQIDLKEKLQYFEQSKNKFHYAKLEEMADDLLDHLESELPDATLELTGDIRRKMPILDYIEVLVGHDSKIDRVFDGANLKLDKKDKDVYYAHVGNNFPVIVYHCPKNAFGSKQFYLTGNEDFVNSFIKKSKVDSFKDIETETAVFEKGKMNFIAPELRDHPDALQWIQKGGAPELIKKEDIKGVIHAHSTYSDGVNTLEEMVQHSIDQGYTYLGITDHSKSAFYANGLKIDRLEEQWAEIDELNKKYPNFTIYKGIESDILNNGNLDYEDAVLKRFDFIIASIHSNLKMDEDKATERLIKAIENPYTTILGHPTGRLLLSRTGYPVYHKKVIDACAANGVSIELNSNPYRLDMDWIQIPYALEKGVKISINPDAHSTLGIHDIHYGICVARKAGLSAAECLNALEADQFLK